MNRIINQIKTLGLMAIMFALVASLAGAGSASASSLSSTSSEIGQVLVTVAFDPSSTAREATVTFFNEQGQPVAKALTDTNGQAKFEFPVGTYKMTVTATGYTTLRQYVKVAANTTNDVKVALAKSKLSTGLAVNH